MSVREIELAITELKPIEIAQLAAWFEHHHSGTQHGSATNVTAESELGPERTDDELAAIYAMWASDHPNNPDSFDNSPLPIVRDGADW